MKISISRDGAELGEWTDDEVRIFYRMGRLVDTDLYWTEGMLEWLPLRILIDPSPISAPVLPPPIPPARKQTLKPEQIGFNRLQFVGSLFLMFLILFLLQIVFDSGSARSDEWNGWGLALLVGTMVLVLLRLQNIGYPVGYSLLIVIPCVGFVVVLICCFAPPGWAELEKAKKLERASAKAKAQTGSS